MNIANKSVLITGAKRGIGQALVNEALKRVRRGCMGNAGWACRLPIAA
jgi:NAD(P)-dependent dehydrogenase (short-subunit alcohol dehydrogenase family)